MTYFTPERLFTIAVVMTLIAADGVYRARRQRLEGTLPPRTYRTFVALLVSGALMAWIGFLVEWR